jgi:hypothetical protein
MSLGLAPVHVSYATQASNLRHLRGARLAAAGVTDDAAASLKRADMEVETAESHEREDSGNVDVKVEDEIEGTASLVSSHVNGRPVCQVPSPMSIVQTQETSEPSPPLSRHSSPSHNQGENYVLSSNESLPRRPSGPLLPILPAHDPVANMTTPVSPQPSLPPSGPPSVTKSRLPNFTKIKNVNVAENSEKFINDTSRDSQQRLRSGGGLQPPPVSAHARIQTPDRIQTPEPPSNVLFSQSYGLPQRPYSPPPRSSVRRQREQCSPPLVRQFIPPPTRLYKRVSDHYSPPPPFSNVPFRAQHYSPPPSPPSPGPSTELPWSRKRSRSTLDTYVPDEEPPSRRPRQDMDRERVVYERPPAAELERQYNLGDDTPNGPQTPPRPASWDRTPEPESQRLYDSRHQPRALAPTTRNDNTAWPGRGESNRPIYEPQPQRVHEVSPRDPDYTEHQTWERQNAARVPGTYDATPVSSESVPLSFRMHTDKPQVQRKPIQRHPSPQQEITSLTLLDRMSDNQRPIPSGPSSQIQHHSQVGNSNNNRRLSGQPRGQTRGGRQPRGRGGGRGSSIAHSNSERQTLAARISGGSALQNRLS